METFQCKMSSISHDDMQRCSACKSAVYCGKQCQVADWPVHIGQCLVSSEVGTVVVTKDGFVMLRMFEMSPYQLYQTAIEYVQKARPTWKVNQPYRWAPDSGPHVSLDKSMAVHKGQKFSVRVDWSPQSYVDYSRWVVLNVVLPAGLKCAPGGGCHISIGQQRPPF